MRSVSGLTPRSGAAWLIEPGLPPKYWDPVMRVDRGDPFSAIAVPGDDAVAVKDSGNQVAVGDKNQLSHRGGDVG